MKKIFLSVMSGFLLVSAFSQNAVNRIDSNGMKQGKWVSTFPGGNKRYEGAFVNGQPVGEWTRYHENGKVKALMNYRPNSGRAFAQLFDEEGKLYAKGVFDGTKRDSTWNFYNGDKIVQTENYRLGKREGAAIGFDHNGIVLWAREYKDDWQDGKSLEYYSDGTKKSEITYSQGRMSGPARFYDEKGILFMDGLYQDDLSEGDWFVYSPDGKIRYKVTYAKGELLNSAAIDSVQLKEFKKYDQVKGKIPEPKMNQADLP